MMKKLSLLIVMVMMVWGTGFSQRHQARGETQREPRMMRHMNRGLRMVEMNLYPPRLLLRMSDRINLTESQVARIKDLDRKHQEWVVKQEAEARLQGIKLKSVFDSTPVNRKALEKAVRSMSDSWTEIRLARINHLLDIRNILTPEQITQVDEAKRLMLKRTWMRKNRGNPREGAAPHGRRN